MNMLENKVKMVIDLNDNRPNGYIVDGDIILADILDDPDLNDETTGLSNEVLEIWLNSTNRKSVEDLFYALTGLMFNRYIDQCIEVMKNN